MTGRSGRTEHDEDRQQHGPGDSIRPFTRLVSIAVLPFLLVASVLLYLFPANTEQHFAWTITPEISARYLASAYLGGIWFFAAVLRQRQWHLVRHGFPAVLTFATLLGVATLLHWDRFHAGHISFLTWTALYLITPFLMIAVLLAQRGTDRGTAVSTDTTIPRGWRIALAGIGLVSMAVGVVLFLMPAVLVDSWAWSLTPLTARVLGATLTLPGMVNVWMLVDSRWSAFRTLFQAQLVSLTFILGAILLGWDQLDFGRPAAWFIVPGLAGSLVAYGLFSLWCEARARAGR